jgi:hypothetical protein
MISIIHKYSLYNIYKNDDKDINLLIQNNYFNSKSFNFIKNFNIHFLIYKFIYYLLKLININSKKNIINFLFILLKFEKIKINKKNYLNPLLNYINKKNYLHYKLDINYIFNINYLYLIINKLLWIEFIKFNINNLKGLIQLPKKYKLYTILRSPLSDKKARDQYYFTNSKIKTIFPNWIYNNLIDYYISNLKGDIVGYLIKNIVI